MRTSVKLTAKLTIGLALSGQSANFIPANAQDVEGDQALPTFEEVVDAYGVDRKTGKYAMKPHTILNIGGKDGLSLTYSDSGGSSLISNFYRKIHWIHVNGIENGQVTVQFGNFSESFSRNPSTNAFTSEYKTGSSLDTSLGYPRYTTRLGVEVHFQTDRTRVVYPDGREVTAYGADEIPTAVVDNFGNMLKFSGSQGPDSTILIQAVNRAVDYCDPVSAGPCSGLTAQRSASSQRSLTNATRTLVDAAGGATVYRMYFNESPSVASQCSVILGSLGCDPAQAGFQYYLYGITFPGSPSENITIDYGPGPWGTQDDVRVRSITIEGDRIDYSIGNEHISVPPEANQRPYFVITRARIGGELLYEARTLHPNGGFGLTRRELVNLRDSENRSIGFQSNQAVEIAKATYPEGNTVGAEYSTDGRNNVVATYNGNLKFLRAYPPSCSPSSQRSCNLPETITDPKTGITSYSYNARGQLLTELKPSVGGIRPRTTNTYSELTAMIRDSAGNTVAAGPAVSLLTSSYTCITQNNCPPTDRITTTYDYGPTTGPNNLRLRGVAVTAVNGAGQTETRRTCYTYNYFGERISETPPIANLASCP